MTKRMILAGMLAMAGSSTLAADTAFDRKAAAATEQAAKQTQPKTETAQVRACTCTHGS